MKKKMASAKITLSEEQFLCSICRDVFTEPVSAPCGHIYCQGCIRNYWSHNNFGWCPICKQNFQGAPELRVDKEFREKLELFKRTWVKCDDSSSSARPGEVLCDVCSGMKRKALKSCLICLASYCDTHLEHHHTVDALKWHELINPVATLVDRWCKKHQKVMEFFCKNDQSCVCLECLRDDHVTHEAISLEEEFKERKTKLKHMKRQVKHTLNEKCIMVKRIRDSMMQGRQEVERTKADTDKAFAALVASIEAKKVRLIELLEQKQKAAEQQAEERVKHLQLEIAEIHRKSRELEELSKNEDDFRLLQDFPSVSSPSSTKHRITARVQHLLQVETLRSAVAKIEETLSKQMENIIREVNLVDEVVTAEEPMQAQTENVFEDELGKIQTQYAIKVTLDPDTAHPSLIVSDDRRQVRDGGTKREVPDSPMRFDSLHFVFGDKGFSSGKFYYEVMLKGQKGWEVGVARESISKKGVNLSLSPENGCWTLGSYWGRYQANTNPPVVLSLSDKLEKVGVFVDYEGGLVSFYNVDTRALIYSFTGCAFTERAPRTYKILWFYTKPTKIYPLFRPSAEEGSDSAPLQMVLVGC